MMLWTAADPAPNPRRVRLFLREKRLTIPETNLEMFKGEHKTAAYLAKNPRGQLPFLELDDGRVIAETIAICRYLDELHPQPPLFGSDAFERAETDMWIRRVEMGLGTGVAQAWVHGHAITAKMFTQVPEIAAAGRASATAFMGWLDRNIGAGQWLAGDRFSMADIALLTLVDFATFIGLAVPETHENLRAWHAKTSARFA